MRIVFAMVLVVLLVGCDRDDKDKEARDRAEKTEEKKANLQPDNRVQVMHLPDTQPAKSEAVRKIESLLHPATAP